MRADGPTACWQCRKAFNKRPDGSLVFSVYQDEIGNPHRVHITCMESLKQEPRITAQIGDTLEASYETHDRLEDARELRESGAYREKMK